MNTKTKIILISLLVLFIRVQINAQEMDSLWNTFLIEFNKGVSWERQYAYTTEHYCNDLLLQEKIVKILTNTTLNEEITKNWFTHNHKVEIQSSTIEERALEYMYVNYARDSLPNIRDFIGQIFYEVAQCSHNTSNRKKAIGYLLDCYLATELHGLRLEDFDNNSKQKLVKQFTRQFSEEELCFFAESHVKYWMINNKRAYDYMIADTLKKYQNTITYEEVKKQIFQSNVIEYKRKFINQLPSYSILIDAAQLNLTEIIPYLEAYVNNEKYEDYYKKYAICALAYMRIGSYEKVAVKNFEGDEEDRDNIRLAKYLNNQDIWYTYIQRLQSKKYYGNCPVAYRSINSLASALKNFPKYYPPEPGWTISTRLLVPEDCDISTRSKKVPIDEDVINIVLDWMETNKGKYELIEPIERTF
jgi:hypothetical protein